MLKISTRKCWSAIVFFTVFFFVGVFPGAGQPCPYPVEPDITSTEHHKPCDIFINAVLDDHNTSDSSYRLKVTLGHKEIYNSSLIGVINHGRPYGGGPEGFANWKAESDKCVYIRANIDPSQPYITLKLELTETRFEDQFKDWIGIASVKIKYPGSDAEIITKDLGLNNTYGPDGSAVLVLYGGHECTIQVKMRK